MAQIKTKARALDMLGRQQIAGIPTALSELFKNAHDAYADNVEVDYIRKRNLLILRDDGLGMTRDEFEERWLTIGTDSKFVDENSIALPATNMSKALRPVMGEKGIGRLSIAAIGPQVLVLTRAKREDGLSTLVASFINWTLFSLPALDLSDIDIPLIEIRNNKMITNDQFLNLLSQAKDNVKTLNNKISQDKIDAVVHQIDSFEFNPEVWYRNLKAFDAKVDDQLKSDGITSTRKLYLDEDGFGTHFVISPVDEILNEEVEGDLAARAATDQASRLEKALLGFTNTMDKDNKPPILARFRDHTADGSVVDRISESIFFTPQEFEQSDHHIKGSFNEFGQFTGTVTIYGEEKREYVLSWPEGLNKPVTCGHFKINLAVIMGTARESKLPNVLWQEIYHKTNKIGGLYIYRDGIRVLPYGDSDVDFLHIEQRRSKTGQAFFSYRRMLGSVELTKENNYALHEKAGREGFIENKAYKQFKSILENFFIQAARDFFNEKGDLSEQFLQIRSRHQEAYDLLKKRENLTSTKKKRLQQQLEVFFKRYDNDYWSSRLTSISEKINYRFKDFDKQSESADDFIFEVQEILSNGLKPLVNNLNITFPAGVGFGKTLTDLCDLYKVKKDKIQYNINELKTKTEKRLVVFEDKFGNRTGMRRRFTDSIDSQTEFQKKQLNAVYYKANKVLEELEGWTKDEISRNRELAKTTLEQVKHDLSSVSFNERSADELYELKASLEGKITETANIVLERVEHIAEQIQTIREGNEQNSIAGNKLTEILESEYEHLKEVNDRNSEMVHLGMAIGIIHHEFSGNVLGIRRALKEMQPWANKNEKLNLIYEDIRSGFEHLEGYLKVFTPLTRRLTRKKVSITGKAVSDFVNSVFWDRLDNEKIQLKVTDNFLKQSIIGFTSTIYPAIINLIDNSIFWLGKASGEKVITLDATSTGFIVKDSGPGIPTIDKDNVFEFAFSRKSGGRGMGLYVVRKTLEDEGFEISLAPYNPNEGACFTIAPKLEQAVIDAEA
ncbi:ATP-binding protein [Alteromonas stellipolaris]|uniref:Regulator n=1 Tax=Alteromonas stellipolaris TaxID=233316 RepID=A0ABN4LI58_9ALTE|nr:ATP-binding protein [Alteromonas stellipolaris]ALM92432.1 Exonuclease SbcC [Alteromonas stellipolaris LMG 21856]AMJ72792.1 regulator [Alteromonas stellipolaris]